MKHPNIRRFCSLLLALTLALALAVPAGAAPEDDSTSTTPPTEDVTETTPPVDDPTESVTPPEDDTTEPDTPSEDDKTETPAATSGDTLTLSTTSQSCYAGVGQNKELYAPKATVTSREGVDVTANYTIRYQWNVGNVTLSTVSTFLFTPIDTGTETVSCTITATLKEGAGGTKPLNAKCTYQVNILPATAVGAAQAVGDGPHTLAELKDLSGEKTILDQLLQGGDELDGAVAIPGLQYVIFDLSSTTNKQAGTLTAVEDVPYYVDNEADGYHLSEVVFTPIAEGTYSVNFRAFGDETYYGSLEIVVTPDKAPDDNKTFSCDSAGFSFSGSDFYDGDDADPVVAVRFDEPSSGRLMRSLSKNDDALTATYYTNSASDGSYHISMLFYLPSPGYNGLATLTATCVTQSGEERTQTIQIDVESKNASSHFTDVTADDVGIWAANAVDFAQAHKLVSGVGEGVFAPNSSMTRAMLVTVLYRAAGQPKVNTSTEFKDLEKDAYYCDAVAWANANDIVNGTTATTFSPNEPVSRQQIATILYRYAKAIDGESGTVSGNLNEFKDKDKVDEYALTGMRWAVQKGILSGTTATTLSPQDQATRAQVVVLLHRYLAS